MSLVLDEPHMLLGHVGTIRGPQFERGMGLHINHYKSTSALKSRLDIHAYLALSLSLSFFFLHRRLVKFSCLAN